MTAPEDRPNFFVLLGLDPEASWEDALFQNALARAQNAWSVVAQSGIRDRPKTVSAQRNLKLLSEIRETMSDPRRRKEEREAARGLRDAEMRTRRRAADERLRVLLARGYLLEAEVAGFRRDYADVLTSDKGLARRLDCAEVRIAAPGASAGGLGSDLEENLGNWLGTVGEASVYEVLKGIDDGITNNSPLERLRAAARELQKQAHRTKDKTDPSVKAKERIATAALMVFASDEERKRHDHSMEMAKLRAVATTFEEALGLAKGMSAAQVELYLVQARDKGVYDVELAKRYLMERLAALGWTVELPAEEVQVRIRDSLQCPRCAELNDPDSTLCRVCHLPMREPCPHCGAVDPRYGGGCGCGFPVGQRYLVEELVAGAQAAVYNHELARADTILRRAERIWALPPDRSDALAAMIHTVRDGLDEAREKLGLIARGIEQLMDARQHLAAAQRLRAAPEGLPMRSALLARADAAIAGARERYLTARRPGTAQHRQVELYVEALRLCDDFEDARVALNQIPLQPPKRLRAAVHDPGAGVVLTWAVSGDQDVSYVVMRSVGGAPMAPTDDDGPGQRRMVTTAETTFRDRDAAGLAGLVLHYAVFTERLARRSAAVTAEPILIAAEATVQCRAEDGGVTLTWSLPEHAISAEVTREELGRGSPVVLKAVDPGRLVDLQVRNGVKYRYTVRTAYVGPDGGLLWSAGRSHDATPLARPSPPGPLVATGLRSEFQLVEHRVRVRWQPPERGSMMVIRQWGRGGLHEGDELPEKDLRREGHVFGESSPALDTWIEKDRSHCSYVPVLVVDGTGYVGSPRRYARAAEPANLYGEFVGDAIRLGWTWPDGITEVLVGHDPAEQPLDPTCAPGRLAVGRLPDERTGGCAIPAPLADQVFVVVASTVKHDGVSFTASGVPLRIDRPEHRIRYDIRPAGWAIRSELTLRTEEPVHLPALVLRAKAGQLPNTPADGVLVARIDPMRLSDKRTVSLPKHPEQGMRYRLFTATTGTTSSVQLDPLSGDPGQTG